MIVQDKAFESLLVKQSKHSKVKQIKYEELKLQSYLKIGGFKQKEAKMLMALRSNCLKGIRHNFSKLIKDCLKCPLQCNIMKPQEDTQDHILFCTKLRTGSHPQINQIYGDVAQQI